MNRIFNKSSKTILLATLIYLLYIAFIVIPFFAYASPPNEATSVWKFPTAPLFFSLLFYPAFWLWSYCVVKNIFDVRYLRTLIYTIVYIITFASIHLLFFIFSAVILWCLLLTLPIGIILLVILVFISFIFDIKDFEQKNKIAQNDNSLAKKITTIVVCYIIIPTICLGLIFTQLFYMFIANIYNIH